MAISSAVLRCSIGVICYNEEQNIANLLDALLAQKLERVELSEIIVVSSACTDGTDEIVQAYTQKDARIRLLTQSQREGKSSAINLFLEHATCEILVVESGDTILAEDSLEKLIMVFVDYKVGAAGGRPMPLNAEQGFMGYAVHALWRMHHRMALLSPKLGEVIAFRKLMHKIPVHSAVDEASIEAIIRAKRLRLRYVPDALIYNKGPQNLADFIKQRRRIYNGHLWLKDMESYRVSSQDGAILASVLVQELVNAPHKVHYLFLLLALEGYCRLLGALDYYVLRRNPYRWDIAQSTKKLV